MSRTYLDELHLDWVRICLLCREALYLPGIPTVLKVPNPTPRILV